MAVLKPHKRRKIPALLLLAAVLWLGTAQAQGMSAPPLELYEEKIKAGLVYNFLKYTVWPAEALSGSNGRLRVCLLGDDSSDGYLYPLEGRTAQQYVIVITRIGSVSDAANCSLVFVHRSQEGALPRLFQFLKGKHVLTVSDIGRFAEQGGMVELGKDNDKISLLINKRALDSSGLSIQSRLLKLARMVQGRNG
jgi:hypothetical protein